MAADSAIASLPYALTAAYKALSDAVSSRRATKVICEAARAFVYEVRKYPAWSAELDRRGTFIESGCADGSPWKQAAEKALKFLLEKLESDDPREAFPGTPYVLRCIVKTGVGLSNQLKDVIDRLSWVLNSRGLSVDARAALEEWWRQSVGLYDEAEAIQADGCRLLNQVYADLRENPTTPSGTLHGVHTLPGLHAGMRDAADSLLHWAAANASAAEAAQGEGNGAAVDHQDLPQPAMIVSNYHDHSVNIHGPVQGSNVAGSNIADSSASYNNTENNWPVVAFRTIWRAIVWLWKVCVGHNIA